MKRVVFEVANIEDQVYSYVKHHETYYSRIY